MGWKWGLCLLMLAGFFRFQRIHQGFIEELITMPWVRGFGAVRTLTALRFLLSALERTTSILQQKYGLLPSHGSCS